MEENEHMQLKDFFYRINQESQINETNSSQNSKLKKNINNKTNNEQFIQKICENNTFTNMLDNIVYFKDHQKQENKTFLEEEINFKNYQLQYMKEQEDLQDNSSIINNKNEDEKQNEKMETESLPQQNASLINKSQELILSKKEQNLQQNHLLAQDLQIEEEKEIKSHQETENDERIDKQMILRKGSLLRELENIHSQESNNEYLLTNEQESMETYNNHYLDSINTRHQEYVQQKSDQDCHKSFINETNDSQSLKRGLYEDEYEDDDEIEEEEELQEDLLTEQDLDGQEDSQIQKYNSRQQRFSDLNNDDDQNIFIATNILSTSNQKNHQIIQHSNLNNQDSKPSLKIRVSLVSRKSEKVKAPDQNEEEIKSQQDHLEKIIEKEIKKQNIFKYGNLQEFENHIENLTCSSNKNLINPLQIFFENDFSASQSTLNNLSKTKVYEDIFEYSISPKCFMKNYSEHDSQSFKNSSKQQTKYCLKIQLKQNGENEKGNQEEIIQEVNQINIPEQINSVFTRINNYGIIEQNESPSDQKNEVTSQQFPQKEILMKSESQNPEMIDNHNQIEIQNMNENLLLQRPMSAVPRKLSIIHFDLVQQDQNAKSKKSDKDQNFSKKKKFSRPLTARNQRELSKEKDIKKISEKKNSKKKQKSCHSRKESSVEKSKIKISKNALLSFKNQIEKQILENIKNESINNETKELIKLSKILSNLQKISEIKQKPQIPQSSLKSNVQGQINIIQGYNSGALTTEKKILRKPQFTTKQQLKISNKYQNIPSLREPKLVIKSKIKNSKADPVCLYQNMQSLWQRQKEKHRLMQTAKMQMVKNTHNLVQGVSSFAMGDIVSPPTKVALSYRAVTSQSCDKYYNEQRHGSLTNRNIDKSSNNKLQKDNLKNIIILQNLDPLKVNLSQQKYQTATKIGNGLKQDQSKKQIEAPLTARDKKSNLISNILKKKPNKKQNQAQMGQTIQKIKYDFNNKNLMKSENQLEMQNGLNTDRINYEKYKQLTTEFSDQQISNVDLKSIRKTVQQNKNIQKVGVSQQQIANKKIRQIQDQIQKIQIQNGNLINK